MEIFNVMPLLHCVMSFYMAVFPLKGFYAVYRKVFEKIAEEDEEFATEPVDAPSFGDCSSSYEEVSSFTLRSYKSMLLASN